MHPTAALHPSPPHFLSILALLIALLVAPATAQSQWSVPLLYNERGDPVANTWPPNDTSYVPNELIVKFRHNKLNYDLLCFEYPLNDKARSGELQTYVPQWFQNQLRAQRFDLDSGIVMNTSLRDAMKGFGGLRLRRMTLANPCFDTLSLSRLGDTLVCRDFDWMVLELDNDTSVVIASMWLTAFYRNVIEFAEPNYFLEQHTEPTDPEYAARQASLKNGSGIGMPAVWGPNGIGQVGRYDIKVAVIDDGIDYTHCDFGNAWGPGNKVASIWDASSSGTQQSFIVQADHGTAIAGIIGAYTENGCPPTGAVGGVAGIGGGWMSATPARMGVQLLGMKIERDSAPNLGDFTVADAAEALRQAAAYNPNWGDSIGYGAGAHVINCSWGTYSRSDAQGGELSLSLLSAVNWAYEHDASVVVSRGNMSTTGSENPATYPSNFNERWLVSVGGSNVDKDRQHSGLTRSLYGMHMDLIAPAGDRTVPAQQIVRTTGLNGAYAWFDGSSAAAAHVSGVIGLLRSETWDRAVSEPAGMWSRFKPEDYEGILEASANDRFLTPDNEPLNSYDVGYDDRTGWGHLQADNAFAMIANGYRIGHYSRADNMSIGEPMDGAVREFTSQGKPEFKSVPDGEYWAEPRSVDFIITLNADNWNTSYDTYVWSHRAGRGGYSLESINNQTDWTQITNGSGNDSDNELHDGIRLVPGDEGELVVEARTYQYDLYNVSYSSGIPAKGSTFEGTFPPDEDLRANFSVFGMQGVLHAEGDENPVPIDVVAHPQPADQRVSLTIDASVARIESIEIVDAQGRSVRRIDVDARHARAGRFDLDVSDLAPGIYLCVIGRRNTRVTTPLIIVR